MGESQKYNRNLTEIIQRWNRITKITPHLQFIVTYSYHLSWQTQIQGEILKQILVINIALDRAEVNLWNHTAALDSTDQL
jgi:uracil-DNA glycosylase